MRTMTLLMIAAVCIAGCDKQSRDKTRQAAKKLQESAGELRDATTQAAAEVKDRLDETQIAAQAKDLVKAVEARDLESLKRICLNQDAGEYREVMGCYYNAFVVEEKQGPDAAKKYLADASTKADCPPIRAKAIGALSEYFNAKGSLRTKEVAAMILIFALETKYPHRGGVVGAIIAHALGLKDI
jgi:hypothetical protein